MGSVREAVQRTNTIRGGAAGAQIGVHNVGLAAQAAPQAMPPADEPCDLERMCASAKSAGDGLCAVVRRLEETLGRVSGEALPEGKEVEGVLTDANGSLGDLGQLLVFLHARLGRAHEVLDALQRRI